MARASSDARAALCLVSLLAMSSLVSCQAAGRIIGTTGADPTTNCVHALGCAPPPPGKPDSDLLCRVYCYQRGYNLLKSYCKPDGGGTCCCVKP